MFMMHHLCFACGFALGKVLDNSKWAEVAKIIQRDDIDVLVDLVGLTANSPAELNCMKPVPVIINYLGMPKKRINMHTESVRACVCEREIDR